MDDVFLFNEDDVVEDVQSLEEAFPDPREHTEALAAILHQLVVVHRRQPGKDLQGWLRGWRRHAFPSRKERGARADLRIAYRREGERTAILGFGHRRLPMDFYERLRGRSAG